MPDKQITQKLKRLEIYHNHRVMDDIWFAVRLDGRNFSKLTANHYKKPYDEDLKNIFIQTTLQLFEEFDCIYAFTVSDEISLLFKKNFSLFNREIEDILSITAAAASSTITLLSQKRMQFDSRIITFPNETIILEYFRWRQDSGFHNFLQDVAYWTLFNKGNSEVTAQKTLNGLNYENKIKLLFKNQVDFFFIS